MTSRFRVLSALTLACIGAGLPRAAAQCTPGWQAGFVLPGADGIVLDSVSYDLGDGHGPQLYICGSFTLPGGQRGPGVARWNGATWEAVGGGFYGDEGGQPGMVVSLAVYKGVLYAGGQFQFVGNHSAAGGFVGYTSARGLARLDNSDLTQLGWGPLTSDLFNNWDANGISISSPSLGIGPVVNAMAVDDAGTTSTADDTLYIAGKFDQVEDDVAGLQSNVNSIVKWNGSSFAKLGVGLQAEVIGSLPVADALAVRDGELFVGGGRDTFSTNGFAGAGGVNGTRNFAKWITATSTWATTGYTPASPPAIAKLWRDRATNTMYVSDSRLFQSAQVLAYNGSTFAPLGPGPTMGTVRAFATFFDGAVTRLYAAGTTYTTSSPPTPVCAAVQRWTGAAWENLPDNLNVPARSFGEVFALASADLGAGPVLLAGGQFLASGPSVVQNLGAFDGASWSASPAPTRALPGFGNPNSTYSRTWKLTVGDEDGPGPRPSSLFAFGNFNNTGGPLSGSGASANIARLDGAAWTPLGAGPGDSIKRLFFFDADGSGNRLHALTDGGAVKRWDPLTATWSTPLPFGSISQGDAGNAIVFDDDGAGPGNPAVFAVGFMHVTPDPETGYRCTLAKWDGATASWTPLGDSSNTVPGTLSPVVSCFLAAFQGSLYAAGPFAFVNPDGSIDYFSHTGVARWNGSAWSMIGTVSNGLRSGDILAEFQGRLYVAATITGVVGSTGLSAWDGASWSGVGGGLSPLPGEPSWSTWADSLHVGDDGLGAALFIAGNFASAGNVPATHNVARWDGSSFSPLAEGLFNTSVPGPDFLMGVTEDPAFFRSIASVNGAVYFTGDFEQALTGGGLSIPSFQFAEWRASCPSGACCTGTICQASAPAACAGAYQGDGVVCGVPGNPTTCCPANINGAGGVSVQDIFEFLAAYFAADPHADFNQSGQISVQDIFDFLAAYFQGCPG